MDTPPLRQLTHPLVHRSLLPLLSTEMFPRYRLTAIATLSTSFSWTALDIISPSHALSTWTFHGWCPRSKSVFRWELRIMEYWIALSRDDESAWIDGSSHGATSSRCFCFRLHLLVPISVALMAPQLWSASLPSPGLLKLLWPCRKINVLSSFCWLHKLCTTLNYPGISECTTITVLRVLPSFGLFSPTILEH